MVQCRLSSLGILYSPFVQCFLWGHSLLSQVFNSIRTQLAKMLFCWEVLLEGTWRVNGLICCCRVTTCILKDYFLAPWVFLRRER